MTVRDLIDMLEEFDEDMEVLIGMQQSYGSDFAMDIAYDVGEYKINAFYGDGYHAVVLTEGSQVGTVRYNDDEEEE